MLGQKYTVQKGDTLWDLAGKHLGNPTAWPKIYEHNNLPQVKAVTKTRIADPDLIFIGQTIYLPKQLPSAQPKPTPVQSPTPPTKSTGKKPATRLKGVPFKYNLKSLPSSKVASPAFVAEIKLTGSITLQMENATDILTVSQENFVLSAKKEADTALNKLVAQNQIGWNPNTKELTFENGITIHSKTPFSPSYSISTSVSSTTGLPVVKATTACPPIKGKINKHLYAIGDLGIEIEITPRPPSAQPKPVPITPPVPITTPRKTGWDYLIGVGLIAGAGILIVATIAEDVVTLGVGVADDVPSFAAASVMFAAGLATMQSVPGQQPIHMEGNGI